MSFQSQFLNSIKRLAHDKINFINIYFYAMNISFVEIFRKIEIHYIFKKEFHVNESNVKAVHHILIYSNY